jgi:hypothetical protein
MVTSKSIKSDLMYTIINKWGRIAFVCCMLCFLFFGCKKWREEDLR